MNRVPTFLLLLIFPLAGLAAQDQGTPSAFVDSEPLGARIVLDGVLLPQSAPTILRGLKPGKHSVQVWKDGYATVVRAFETGPDSVPTLEIELPSASAVLAFPGTPLLADPRGALETPGREFRFPMGTYDLSDSQGVFQVRPVWPDEGILAVAGWGLALTAGSALVFSLSDAAHMGSGWVDHPGTVTMALWISSLFELPWYLSLQGRKARFLRDTAPAVSPLIQRQDLSRNLFDRGEDALQSGSLDQAEAQFTQLVKEYPDSRLVPGAWFRLARIHSVTGRREQALGEYRLVAETYPQAAYHDRARKALADLYEAEGDPEQAIGHLDKMVLADGFFDPSDIAVQKVRLIASREAPHAP